MTNKLNIQHNIEAKIDLFKETCHKFLSKINDPKIVTERLKKDIIKLVIDEVVIDGEKLKISATIPLPSKIHEREIIKTDLPDTFNAGATLGPINQTKMERIWTKHKQLNTTLKPKVFVALSGGVDSSVAAALIIKQGYQVIGAFMKNWSPVPEPSVRYGAGPAFSGQCKWYDERRDALRVAARLGIPFVTFDFEEEYRRSVVDYLFKEYAAGRTPNPDVVCNRQIKFPLLLSEAKKLGCQYLATGHYARIKKTNHTFQLLKAKDKNKDQSYFLHQLRSNDLSKILFPIGNYTKPAVRALARKFNLPTAEKDESMGICFIGEVPMTEFLKQKIKPRPGQIVDVDSGLTIGEHEGLAFYTIGQRHGLAIAGDEPYYVAGKDLKKNVLIVAKGPDHPALFKKECRLGPIHWIAGAPPKLPLKMEIKLRHRHPGVKATLYLDNHLVLVRPERAVTPGQFAVFYKGEECLGGAEIV